MKKACLIGITAVLLIVLCGCVNTVHPMLNSRLKELDRQESRENVGIQKIIDALNAKDREAVKAAFSSSALDETGDIEDGIDYLFALIPDEIQDCVEDKRITSTSRKDGHNKEDMKTWYIVSTESNTYAFFLLENTIDNEQPENLGIYTLRACKEEDKAEHFSSWQKMQIAGIYVPDVS